MERADLKEGREYRNIKTCGVYTLLRADATESENQTEYAVYQSNETGRVWVRPLGLFLTKFEPYDRGKEECFYCEKQIGRKKTMPCCEDCVLTLLRQ